MNIQELISEVRRNPDKNTRKHPIEVVADMYENTTDTIGGTRNLFVTRTELQKVGINPQSDYDTPNGIYLWQASAFLSYFAEEEIMHWSGAYVNILKLQGNIVNLTKTSLGEYNTYLARLVDIIHQKTNNPRNSIYREIKSGVDEEIDRYDANLTEDSYGYQLYLAASIGANLLYGKSGNHAMSWSNTFRKIGIDGILDNGTGIIHDSSSEMHQGVIFSRAAILKGSEIALNAPEDYLDPPGKYKHLSLASKATRRINSIDIVHRAPDAPDQAVKDLLRYLKPGDRVFCSGFPGIDQPIFVKYNIEDNTFLLKDPRSGRELTVGAARVKGYT